jgi:hypothetical protein
VTIVRYDIRSATSPRKPVIVGSPAMPSKSSMTMTRALALRLVKAILVAILRSGAGRAASR